MTIRDKRPGLIYMKRESQDTSKTIHDITASRR
jgi:hypothetical protein